MITLKKPDVAFIISILAIILMPGFVYVQLGQNSLAPGLMIAAFIVIVINFKGILEFKIPLSRLIIGMVLVTLVLISTSITFIFEETSKPFFSLLLLLFILFSAAVFSVKLNKMNFRNIDYSLFLVIFLLLGLGWINLLSPITWGEYALRDKPVFPFSEESHYALCVGLLSMGYAVTGSKNRVVFINVNMMLHALIFPSLTMLLASILTLFSFMIRLRPKYFIFTLLTSLCIIVTCLFILTSSNSYFSSRLAFENSRNLTTLVFLQGWSLAFVNMVNTNGIGLGFQMLGMPGTHLTPFSTTIDLIAGKAVNLDDGGLVAAKIIAECGIFGLSISVIYIVFIITFLRYANSVMSKTGCTDNGLLLKRCLLCGLLFGFFIEFFFRGNGYFSPGIYLVASVLLSSNRAHMNWSTQKI